MSGNQPSVTLYVSNLNTKVPKEEIRRSLYALFGPFGKVLDVVHVRTPKVRGTAFVVFRDLASSTAAMRGLDGEGFYGKSLRVAYAKSTSHATVAAHEGPEAVYAIKLGLRSADGQPTGPGQKLVVSGAQKRLADEKRKEKRGRESDEEEEEEEDDEDDEDKQPEKKKGRQEENDDEEDDAMEEESDDDAPEPARPAIAEQGTAPNPSLFVQGLPTEVTTDMLSALFQQYSGLSSVRLLPASSTANGTTTSKHTGAAMIVYETAVQAGVAREALDGFLVDRDASIQVHFAATR
ncbi:hypothetical protein JCM10212_003306 [Sporobolomyces blumeae]